MLLHSRNNIIETVRHKKGEISDRNPWHPPILAWFGAFVLKMTFISLSGDTFGVRCCVWGIAFWKSLILLCLSSSPSHTYCAAPTPASRPHVSDHPAQHQLHRGGRTCHPAGDPVSRQPVHVDGDSRRRVTHLQSLASGAGHRVPDQCPTHPSRGGRHGGSWTSSDQQDKVCR